LIRDAIKAARINAELHVVEDGEKAIRVFQEFDRDESLPCPALVLLDINLPRRTGTEVLQEIRKTRCSSLVPVLIVTSARPEGGAELERLGVAGYFQKPSDYDGFMKLGEVIKAILETAGSARAQ
jgi:DNA-binding response OmpR family regulator